LLINALSRCDGVFLGLCTACRGGTHPKKMISDHFHREKIPRYSLVFDLLGHSQKGLLDVCCALGGGFQEWNAELFGEFLFMGNQYLS
jgi:hypothetical protein